MTHNIFYPAQYTAADVVQTSDRAAILSPLYAHLLTRSPIKSELNIFNLRRKDLFTYECNRCSDCQIQ
jgi:hypothetical protein